MACTYAWAHLRFCLPRLLFHWSLGAWCRFKEEKREHGAVQRELDAANERFKEYERKDVKLREDAKHLGGKAKKLHEKQARDAARAQVGGRSRV